MWVEVLIGNVLKVSIIEDGSEAKRSEELIEYALLVLVLISLITLIAWGDLVRCG